MKSIYLIIKIKFWILKVTFHNMIFNVPCLLVQFLKNYVCNSKSCYRTLVFFKFMLKIKQDFSHEAYHSRIKCSVASLLQNQITRVTLWSQLEEAVRFLDNVASSQKRDILHEQAAMMSFKSVGERKHSNATILRAFCFSLKTAYRQFCQDFKSSGISTLTT